MKVKWEKFAQRRNINIEMFSSMPYKNYESWCNIRKVEPISRDSYELIQKTSEKNFPDIDLYLHWGLRKPPQIDPGREKTGSRTKPVSRRHANRTKIVRTQRGWELWDGQSR